MRGFLLTLFARLHLKAIADNELPAPPSKVLPLQFADAQSVGVLFFGLNSFAVRFAQGARKYSLEQQLFCDRLQQCCVVQATLSYELRGIFPSDQTSKALIGCHLSLARFLPVGWLPACIRLD